MASSNNEAPKKERNLISSRPPPIEIGQPLETTQKYDSSDSNENGSVKNIVTYDQSLAQQMLANSNISSEKLLVRTKTKYWKEFEFYCSTKPNSTHGKMVLYWDRILEDYNDKDVFYYKPPDLQLSDVHTQLSDLKINIRNFDPKTINNITCKISVIVVGILIAIVLISLGLVLKINELLFYIMPAYLVILFVVVLLVWLLGKKWTHKKFLERQKAIENKLNEWNKNKFIDLKQYWKCGGLGAWQEITHEVKKDYGVYTNYCGNRGFTADSDAMQSPTKFSGTPTIFRYRDSWSATNTITPNLKITPKQIRTPKGQDDTPTQTLRQEAIENNHKNSERMQTEKINENNTSSNDDVEVWDTHVQQDNNSWVFNMKQKEMS